MRFRIAVGFLASLVVAISSWNSAAVLEPFIASLTPGFELTARTGGSPLAATFTVIALAVMIWAWWDLKDSQLTAAQWRLVMVLWALPLLVAAPLQSRDMYSYAAQGQLLNEGLSPYLFGVRDMASPWVGHTSAIWLASPSPYGPFFLMIARAIAYASGGSILFAIFSFRLLAVLSLVAIAWATTELGYRLGHSPERSAKVAWLALANPFVLTQVVAGGHNDALLIALILVAVVRAWNGGLGMASVLVALAAMVKVTAIIALPFVALLWVVVNGHLTVGTLRAALLRATGYALMPAVFLSIGLGLGFNWVIPVGGLEEGVSPSLVSAVGLVLGTLAGFVVDGQSAVTTAVQISQALGVLVMGVLLVITFLSLTARLLAHAPAPHTQRPTTAPQPNLAHVEAILQGLAIGLAITAALAPTIRVWYIVWFLPVAALVITGRSLFRALAILTAVATLMVFPDGNSVGIPLPNLVMSIAGIALLIRLTRWWLEWVRVPAPTALPAAALPALSLQPVGRD